MSGINFNRLLNQTIGWAKLIGEVGVKSTYNIVIMGGKEIQKQYKLYVQKHGKPALPFSKEEGHAKPAQAQGGTPKPPPAPPAQPQKK